MQNDLNPRKRAEATRPIYRVLQTTSIKGAPASFPPTLFIVPQAPAPLRPHSHDPQRRATFGTTSSRCIYGEGFSLCHVGGGHSFARVVVPTTIDRGCIYRVHVIGGHGGHCCWLRIAGSRKFTIGTVSRHDSRHVVSSPLILLHPRFFLLPFYELSRAIVNSLLLFDSTSSSFKGHRMNRACDAVEEASLSQFAISMSDCRAFRSHPDYVSPTVWEIATRDDQLMRANT